MANGLIIGNSVFRAVDGRGMISVINNSETDLYCKELPLEIESIKEYKILKIIDDSNENNSRYTKLRETVDLNHLDEIGIKEMEDSQRI